MTGFPSINIEIVALLLCRARKNLQKLLENLNCHQSISLKKIDQIKELFPRKSRSQIKLKLSEKLR